MASQLLEGLSATEKKEGHGWSSSTRFSQNANAIPPTHNSGTPTSSTSLRRTNEAGFIDMADKKVLPNGRTWKHSPGPTPLQPTASLIWPPRLISPGCRPDLLAKLVPDTGQSKLDSGTIVVDSEMAAKAYSQSQMGRTEVVEPGMQLLVLCNYCGTLSVNRLKCDSCNHLIPTNAKTVKKPIGNVIGIKKKPVNIGMKPKVDMNIVKKLTLELTNISPGASSSGVSKKTFYGNSSSSESSSGCVKMELPKLPNHYKKATNKAADLVLKKVRQQRSKLTSKRKHADDPPECLTISSDDEEDRNPANREMSKLTIKRLQESMKEKVSHAESSKPDSTTEIPIEEQRLYLSGGAPPTPRPAKQRKTNLVKGPSLEINCQVSCRSVRIGSYKANPLADVVISREGIIIQVMLINDEQQTELHIPMTDIVRCMAHFGVQMPILFVYTTPSSSDAIRARLNMTSCDGPYYDSGSIDETQKRITLVITKINEEQKRFIQSVFRELAVLRNATTPVLEEIEQKIANEILVRSTPPEIRNMLKFIRSSNNMPSSPSNVSQVKLPVTPPPHHQVVKLVVYPPPPATGGITITNEDFTCLREGEFLNDVIIDFYLKFLLMEKLSEADRKRTHVFSSFFYKRLTQRPLRRSTLQEEQNLPAPERRHSRVKTWSRHVDIFEKDFIIIPINENAHWYLAIICYPALTAPVYKDNNQPVEQELLRSLYTPPRAVIAPPRQKLQVLAEEKLCLLNDGTQIIVTTMNIPPDEGEDRDEAEPDDPELPPDTNPLGEDAGSSQGSQGDGSRNPLPPQKRPIKQSCILIFDSLAGPSRNRVIATLREYLQVEWKVKKRTPRSFTKNNIIGFNPNVPQQTNFSDCGVYVLQYVETFFEKPVADYRIPIMDLEDWFTEEHTNQKRDDLKDLIMHLMGEQQGGSNQDGEPMLDNGHPKNDPSNEPDSTTSNDPQPRV